MRGSLTLFLLFCCLGCQQRQSSEPAAQATPSPAPAASTPNPPAAAVQPSPTAPAKAEKAASAPGKPAAQKPPDHPLRLADSPMGVVTFDHARHRLDCVTCHHASRPEKPAAAEQACRTCHTKPAQPGMTTARQAAFHNATATAGTCIDCHKKSGGNAPTTCKQCHVKGAAGEA